MSPNLYVIAGPNGSGKTTFAREFLPNQVDCKHYFMWIPDAELSLKRIEGRVAEGGHDIPEAVVRRRFDRSLRNFWTLYRPLAESWTVYDNSGLEFEEVVFEERGGDWDASTQVWKIARPGAPKIISNPNRCNEFLAKVVTL